LTTWKKIAWLDEVALVGSTHPENVKVQTAAEGSSTEASRVDHLHNIDVAVPAAITEGASQGEGSSTSLARADHVHETPATWAPDAHVLSGHGAATGAVDFGKQAANNLVLENAASKATPAKGQIFYDTDDDHLYVCTAA